MRRGTLAGGDARRRATRSSRPTSSATCPTRAIGATSSTATGRRSRTWHSPRSGRSPAGSRRRRGAPGRRASTASSCTSPTRTRWRRSSRSRTARTDAYGGSFENRMRLPLEVIAAVREAVGPRLPGRLPVPRQPRTSWARTAACAATRLEDAQAIGVELAPRRPRLPLDLARRQVRRRASSRRWARPLYPYTGHSGARLHPPRASRTRSASTSTSRRASATRCAAAGFTMPVVAAGKIHTFEQAEAHPARGAGRPDRHGARPARRPRPARASGGPAPTRRGARLRVLPLLRGRGPAPPRRDVHALAQVESEPSAALDTRGVGAGNQLRSARRLRREHRAGKTR